MTNLSPRVGGSTEPTVIEGKPAVNDDSENDLNSGTSSEPWSLTSGISKNVETWGSPRGGGKVFQSSGPPTIASTALTQIYTPPSQSMPSTPQGIVAHALNVAGDHRPLNIKAEASFRKVAKKRRKQNGGVDVEHTKSSKEFLRKAQHALRVAQDESEEEDLLPPVSGDSDCGSVDPHPRSTLTKGILTTVRSKAMEVPDEEVSDGSNNTGRTHSTSPTMSSSGSNSVSSNNLYGYEDPDSARAVPSGNQYGYEDPDHAMASAPRQRPRGSARRRCSVTEYSLRAVHQAAATAAMERLQRLKLAREHLEATMKTPTAGSANTQPSTTSTQVAGVAPSASKPQVTSFSNDYGYEDPDAAKPNTNPYGYEDPASSAVNQKIIAPPKVYGHQGLRMPVRTSSSRMPAPSQPMQPPSRPDSNPYGYEDTTVPLQSQLTMQPQVQPRRRRAQRRGSVTKFSLQAAKDVAQTAKAEEASNSDMVIDPVGATDTISPISTAPTMPTRKASPWQAAKAARMAALARNAMGPPVVQASAIRSKGRTNSGDLLSESFRKSLKPDAPHYNGDALSVSFRTNHSTEFLSDSSDEESSQSSSESDDESFDESITSITIPLKGEASGSDRIMRPPSRHDSFRSFTSRGSTHSVESDGDSLAPDMQSLCSISFREQASQAGGPPIPTYLPRTPTNKVSRKAPSATNSMDSLDSLSLEPSRHSRLGESLGKKLSFRDRMRGGRERYVDRLPSGSIPSVAYAGRDGETSPIPSPNLKPRKSCARSTSGSSGKSLTSNFFLSSSTLPVANTGQSLGTNSDDRLGGAGTGRGMK